MDNKYIIRIPIGDWSKDGHGRTRHYFISCNYDVHTLRKAYKDSCLLMGVQFNHNRNYSGLEEHYKYGTERHICTDYENNSLSSVVVEIFTKHNCPYTKVLKRGYFKSTKEFIDMLLWFISNSLKDDFTFEFVSNKKAKEDDLKYKDLNGYWNDELNVQFGYGLFILRYY